jgi:hypothetical protein
LATAGRAGGYVVYHEEASQLNVLLGSNAHDNLTGNQQCPPNILYFRNCRPYTIGYGLKVNTIVGVVCV